MQSSSPRKEPAAKENRIPTVMFDLISHEMLEYLIAQPISQEKKSMRGTLIA